MGRTASALLINFGIAAVSLLLCLVAFEIALSAGLFYDDLSWTPSRDKLIDREINLSHKKIASSHPFGFNDHQAEFHKPPGISFRIVILGDSYVSGVSLKEEDRWTRKLEAKLKAMNPAIELLSWGRPGWSTEDELAFFRKEGGKYQIDLLILAFVHNDPDLKLNETKRFIWQESPFFMPARSLFPNSFDYISSHINQAAAQLWTDYKFPTSSRYYEPFKLRIVEEHLKSFQALNRARNVNFAAVLLANAPNSSSHVVSKEAGKLFNKLKIDFLDTLPEIERRFLRVDKSRLRATRADGHPSAEMNTAYAEEVYRFVMERREKYGLKFDVLESFPQIE